MNWTPRARRGNLGAAAAAAVLMGCNPPLPPVVPTAAAVGHAFPEEFYVNAQARGEPVFKIDGASSFLSLHVHRAGELARLGHDHMVSGSNWRGYALIDPAARRFVADIELPLSSLVVDDESLRREAGLPLELTPAQIEGTRRNMMDIVLEAARFPQLQAHLVCEPAALPCTDVRAEIHLHGRQHEQVVHLDRALQSGETFAASGCFTVRQSDFGIVPLSVLHGALRVGDDIDACFRVRGQRIDPG
jgi:hypothetical protein